MFTHNLKKTLITGSALPYQRLHTSIKTSIQLTLNSCDMFNPRAYSVDRNSNRSLAFSLTSQSTFPH